LSDSPQRRFAVTWLAGVKRFESRSMEREKSVSYEWHCRPIEISDFCGLNNQYQPEATYQPEAPASDLLGYGRGHSLARRAGMGGLALITRDALPVPCLR